jgi:hypothetical protein
MASSPVGEGGRDADRPDFTKTAQALAALEEIRHHFGRVGQRREHEGIEIALAHMSILERQFGIERGGQPPHHARLNIGGCIDPIEYAAGIGD